MGDGKRETLYSSILADLQAALKRDRVTIEVCVEWGWFHPWLVDGWIRSAKLAILFWDGHFDHKAEILRKRGILVLGINPQRPFRAIVRDAKASLGIGKAAPMNFRQATRVCLMCDAEFLSDGPWNRICKQCEKNPEVQSDLRTQERERRINLPKRPTR